jgi:multidrug efflux system outer membrane protein
LKYITFKTAQRMLRSILFSGFFLLQFCTVGPKYRRPQVVNTDWTWKKDPAKTQQPSNIIYETKDSLQVPKQWWGIFHDDTLNALIEKTFEVSPTLKMAAGRIIEARGNVGIARANFFPLITLDPYANRTQLSGNRPSQIGYNSLPQLVYNTFGVPLDLSYEVDVWGKFRKNQQGAEANLSATRADYEVVKLGLSADIVSNYLMLRLYDNQTVILSRTLDTRKQNYNLAQSAYQSGLNSQLDVAQAEIEMVTVEGQLSDVLRNRALTENALALLIGLPASSFKIAPRTTLPQAPFIPLDIPSDLLRRRPDVAEAEQQLIYANAQVGIAVTNFLPSVKLNGSAGYLSSRTENIFNRQSVTYLGGVTVNIPLFAGGRNIAARTIAEARVNEAQANYQQKALTAIREVQDAMENIERRTEQIAIQQRALDAANRTAKMSVALYQTGLTTYVNVVLAERSALDAENTLLGVIGQRLLYSVLLVKALGGGWEE